MQQLYRIIPDGFWSLFHMPDGFWRVPLQRNTLSMYFYISLGVVRSLP